MCQFASDINIAPLQVGHLSPALACQEGEGRQFSKPILVDGYQGRLKFLPREVDWRQFWDTSQLHSGELVALNQLPSQGMVEYGAKAAELDVESDGRFLLVGLCSEK